MSEQPKFTGAQAKVILLRREPHDRRCRRHALGVWDRGGACQRCAAFAALNDALSAASNGGGDE